ncbi:MAG: flagellar hook capping FlgD N-terminal domain-containing protein [Legionella sp.]|nr:flagellar hook capping FlgD N-terminal domain-containing protein [Legionella sp.]
MTEPVSATEVGQTEYMKLFMQELTYQDPLKPIDNREFMAQMAQFSALQEARSTNMNLDKLININYGNRAINLLGRNVKIASSNSYGEVRAVIFDADGKAQVTVSLNDSSGSPTVSAEHIVEVS